MGRQALILIAGFGILVGLIKLNLGRNAARSGRMSSERYYEANARSAAYGGAELAMNQLWQNPSWRTGYSNLNISGATVNVNVYDSSTDTTLGQDTLRLAVSSSMDGKTAQVAVKLAVGSPNLPNNVKGGISAQAWIGTLGNMLVDGRQHDLNGNLIANSGTKAIVTTDGYICGGGTKLAGTTDAGVDLGPIKTGYEPIVEEFYSWPGSYPATPEDVLGGAAFGMTPNILKTMAQSSANGSQYATDGADLSFPLNGITYVELPYGGKWSPVDFGPNSSGILIVHNQWRNALVENLNGGIFGGLVIADDLLHVNVTIIGAIFMLTEWPRSGYCIGNGNGQILFSEEAIINSLEEAQVCLAGLDVIEYWE